MATGHPRTLFFIVNISPGSIVMDMVIIPQSRDAGAEINLASPMEVLHSLQQKTNASLHEGKLTQHIAGIEQIQPYALDQDAEREVTAFAQKGAEPEPSGARLQADSAFQASGTRKATNGVGTGWAQIRSMTVRAPVDSGVVLSSLPPQKLITADLGHLAPVDPQVELSSWEIPAEPEHLAPVQSEGELISWAITENSEVVLSSPPPR